MDTLIPVDNHFAVMAALFVIAAIGFLAEKTRIGAVLTGAVVAIFLAILLSNLGVIPSAAPAYDFVWTYFVPMLIPLFLMKADLRKMLFETTRMTGAFLLASFGTVLGVIVAFNLVDTGSFATAALTEEYGSRHIATAGAFVATYIGGSVNYGAVLETTQLRVADNDWVGAMTSIDNLYSGLFLAVLALMPGINWIANRFPSVDHSQETVTLEEDAPISPASLTYAAAYALVVVVIGSMIADALNGLGDDFGSKWRFAIIGGLSLIPATLFPKAMARMSGGYQIGLGLSFVFFAMIAAGANVVTLISEAPVLILIIAIVLVVHGVVVFGLGALLRLSLPELIIASNAAVLGATTAPALAAAKGWKNLVTPGVLVGVLGYAIGTPIANLVFGFWPG